jgi:glutamate transport system substrate-binding protein
VSSARTRGWCTIIGALIVLTGCAPAPGLSTSDSSILRGPIVVGVLSDLPGFSVGSLNPAGFDIDLMNAIGAELNTPVTSKPFTFADRERMLNSGNVMLAIAAYSITPQRNQAGIDFAGPYMAAPMALLIRADDASITNKDSLKGKSVCVVAGTTSEGVNIPGANMTTKDSTTEQCVESLNMHNTDAVLSDSLIFYGYTHANPGKFKVVLARAFGELQYLGIGMLGHHHAECLRLNTLIKDYLRRQWRHDFETEFPDAVAAYSGSNTSKGDFESQFKPKDSDMEMSCKL